MLREVGVKRISTMSGDKIAVKFGFYFGVGNSSSGYVPVNKSMAGSVKRKVTNHAVNIRQIFRGKRRIPDGFTRQRKEIKPGFCMYLKSKSIYRIFGKRLVVKQQIRTVQSDVE